MQVQHEPLASIESLQKQIESLTAENKALKEQLARKEQFMAMIAHDLLSPLTPIINYARIIVRQLGGEPKPNIRRSANIIISQAQRMTRLVNDLRDTTHLEANKFTLKPIRCDIVEIVRETAEQLRPIAPHHKIEIHVPSEPVIGMYDRGRLQQVLGNLLDNAIKYSDNETVITLRVWTTTDSVCVSVHNVGVGIPANETGMLFQPFVRLSGVGKQQGSGLGLYISQSIIQAHHGTLNLIPNSELAEEEQGEQEEQKSSKEGQKGVTFRFTLPRSQ